MLSEPLSALSSANAFDGLASSPEVVEHFGNREQATNFGFRLFPFTDPTNLVGIPTDFHNCHIVDFLNAGGDRFNIGLVSNTIQYLVG